MIRCQSCGQNNSGGSNFCRFCGSKIHKVQQQKTDIYQKSPPKPYSWQTGEFQSEQQPTRPTEQIDRHQQNTNYLQDQQMQRPQPNINRQMQPQYKNMMSAGYHCPYCNSNAMPEVVKKVSPTGWAVFTILLITTIVFFWIGLLIQEEARVCPVCNMRVG